MSVSETQLSRRGIAGSARMLGRVTFAVKSENQSRFAAAAGERLGKRKLEASCRTVAADSGNLRAIHKKTETRQPADFGIDRRDFKRLVKLGNQKFTSLPSLPCILRCPASSDTLHSQIQSTLYLVARNRLFTAAQSTTL
jgi:hypothetical protein